MNKKFNNWLCGLNTIDKQWVEILTKKQVELDKVSKNLIEKEFLYKKQYGKDIEIFPPKEQIFRAFSYPPSKIKVVIIGQDPYQTPGFANGLAFSVNSNIKILPRSLQNIYKELKQDLGKETVNKNGDLSSWESQGVMLLNKVLTVTKSQANSHNNIGWQNITQFAISELLKLNPRIVGILWGKNAKEFNSYFNYKIESAHPSPLSANKGFFGSKPFSKTNKILSSLDLTPIKW